MNSIPSTFIPKQLNASTSKPPLPILSQSPNQEESSINELWNVDNGWPIVPLGKIFSYCQPNDFGPLRCVSKMFYYESARALGRIAKKIFPNMCTVNYSTIKNRIYQNRNIYSSIYKEKSCDQTKDYPIFKKEQEVEELLANRSILVFWKKIFSEVAYLIRRDPPKSIPKIKDYKKVVAIFPNWIARYQVQVQRLTDLDLSNLQLTALPPEIGKLTALEKLHLNNNNLRALPPEIGKLTVLWNLDLSENDLHTLPPEFGKLARLKSLSLQNNSLVDLPKEIGELRSLETVMLRDNKLTAPPLIFSSIPAMKFLLLTGNNYTPSSTSDFGKISVFQ